MAITSLTTVGRRKTSTASVHMTPTSDDTTILIVNGKTPIEYFKTEDRVDMLIEAIKKAETAHTYRMQVTISGGGLTSQAGAARHAIARALVKAEPSTRKNLKLAGFLTRDPRAKERKKPGLVKARKRKQWSKR